MKKSLIAAVSAAALLLLQACGGDDDSSGAGTSQAPANGTLVSSSLARNTSLNVSDADAAALREGNTAFAADIYKTLGNDPQFANKNLFFSPYSLSVALAMTSAGARGATASELKNAMHFTLPDDRLHTAFGALDLALTQRPPAAEGKAPVALNIANSLWGEATMKFEQPFLDTLAVDYGAGVRLADFISAPDTARVAINDWVAGETKDKIRDILPNGSITTDTRAVLVNAVYFKADWSSPFSVEATVAGTFHGPNGDTDAQMMHTTDKFAYGAGSGWRAVRLPYDGGLTFTAILPDDLAAFESSLDATRLAGIDGALQPTRVDLTMPKFKIEDASFSATDALKTLGVKALFDEKNADLSGIANPKPRKLFVGNILHKAFIDVDEKGTEAAAATGTIFGVATAAPQPLPVTLVLDKPFVFLIRDNATGAVLFLGRYVGG
ncbi:MAG: serpin family protein [Burkholderiaceae bacterium]|jgi:serpin B|nr:serpin family protein [Burkholderiaceae bacterium]